MLVKNMQFYIRRLPVVLMSVLFCAVLSSQAAVPSLTVRLIPDPRIPGEAASADIMDAELFIRTALIASGSPDEEIVQLTGRLHDAYAYISGQIPAGASAAVRAEKTLSLLYEVILSSYSENQTFVNTALASGVYNCVSSDILFMYLMKREGIPVT
ncbi:MAG: hypothetical protein M0P01_12100, partial [Treponema sp.]|nr:hypothetical protein [Treponema sp.]